ncbi:MAG: hypothetical protein WBP13_06265 [Methylophilaceae bacterium]
MKENDKKKTWADPIDSFVIDFDNKATAAIISGLVVFYFIYTFLSTEIKSSMKGYMLDNYYGLGSALVFFSSALLYFLICSTLGKRTNGNKYVLSNKYFWVKNSIYFLLFLAHISLGVMLGIFLLAM